MKEVHFTDLTQVMSGVYFTMTMSQVRLPRAKDQAEKEKILKEGLLNAAELMAHYLEESGIKVNRETIQ